MAGKKLIIIGAAALLLVLAAWFFWPSEKGQLLNLGKKTAAFPTPTVETSSGEKSVNLPNPASENCLKSKGQLVIKKLGNGAEYGVCVFEDNRQCEEWAFFRGQCPAGGVKITGFDNESQVYCAILGGQAQPDQCNLPGGKICDLQDLFAGRCPETK